MRVGKSAARGRRPEASRVTGGAAPRFFEDGGWDGRLPIAVGRPPVHDAPGCGRGTRQRAVFNSRLVDRTVETVEAINLLAGFETPRVSSYSEMSEVGQHIFTDILARHRANDKLEASRNPKEAFQELLGAGVTPYQSGGKTEPYRKEMVAWPDVAGEPVPLASLVPEAYKTLVNGSDDSWLWKGADDQAHKLTTLLSHCDMIRFSPVKLHTSITSSIWLRFQN